MLLAEKSVGTPLRGTERQSSSQIRNVIKDSK